MPVFAFWSLNKVPQQIAPQRNKPCQFYRLQKLCLQTKFELSKWTLALPGPVFAFRSLNKVPQQMAPQRNKPCQFYGLQKLCLQTKFELSKWTLTLSVPISSFQSLNEYPFRWHYCKINHAIFLDEKFRPSLSFLSGP